MKPFESLTYTNARGESITFGIGSKFHVNVQKDVSGISDLKNTIYSTSSMGQHGDTYAGNRIEPRDIEMSGKIKDPGKDTQLSLRRQMLKILNPELDGTLYYNYGNFSRKIGAKVKESPRFSHRGLSQEFSILFKCLDPFWREETDQHVDMASWLPDWVFPTVIDKDDLESMIYGHREITVIVDVYNAGHVSTGMLIQFKALGSLTGPELFNLNTREFMKIDYTMQADDVITVDTSYGNKSITLLRGGVKTNLYRYMNVDSTFLQLDIGDNLFRYNADSGLTNLEVTVNFAQKYLGV
jgi:hypothetical protein